MKQPQWDVPPDIEKQFAYRMGVLRSDHPQWPPAKLARKLAEEFKLKPIKPGHDGSGQQVLFRGRSVPED